jgi:hypothetical protein
VLPVPTLRGQVAELSGSMALSVLFAFLGTALWTAVGQAHDRADIGTVFFLTVAACWAVLVPGKVWAYHKGDSWMRRLVMMFLGVLVGLGALWVNGWVPQTAVDPGSPPSNGWLFASLLPTGSGLTEGAAYVSYFALTFFALRWWRMADPRRSSRFSFLPILAAGFWGLLALLIPGLPHHSGAPVGAPVIALVLTAAIVQLVSPWEHPVPPANRRLRLRCS